MNSTSSNPSIQSHLSTACSHYRVRSSKQNFNCPKTQPHLSIDVTASTVSDSTFACILGLARLQPLPAFIACMAIIYGTFAVIFLSSTLYYKFIFKDLAEHADLMQPSLSRHFSFQSSLHPFAIRGETPTPGSITACLWLEELEDPVPLLAWTSRWPGEALSDKLLASNSGHIRPHFSGTCCW